MDDDIIILDSDDETSMDIQQQRGETLSVENDREASLSQSEKSNDSPENESLSFFDFKPYSLDDIDDDEDGEDDYDPTEAAFVDVSYYVNEMRHKKSYENLFDFLTDLAREAGATEEDIEKLGEITDKVAVTAEIKRELWDECVEEAVYAVPEETEVVDVLDEDVEEPISAESCPVEEPISSKPEPDCIVIDD
uniref:Uncharacterized protein n=1 Tax=Panagrolaimus sp. ES5 TaxID=591445 RepID=A0AC34FZF6_9BILA